MARYSTKLKPKPKPQKSPLPIILVVAGLGLLLFAAWALFGGKSPPQNNVEVKGAPRLKVEQTKVDHGNVKLGTVIRDDVRVTNVGDQPLQFTEAPFIEVKAGC